MFRMPKLIPVPGQNMFSDGPAAAEAARIMSDVWKNEETRFGNLNTRAVAVLSATSIIATILGFFSKNLFDTSSAGFQGSARFTAACGIFVALGLLVATAGVVVFGCLLPSHRAIFGNNDLTKGEDKTAQEIDNTAFNEYQGIYVILANRSAIKAYWLTWAYVTFFLAVLAAAVTTAILVNAID